MHMVVYYTCTVEGVFVPWSLESFRMAQGRTKTIEAVLYPYPILKNRSHSDVLSRHHSMQLSKITYQTVGSIDSELQH